MSEKLIEALEIIERNTCDTTASGIAKQAIAEHKAKPVLSEGELVEILGEAIGGNLIITHPKPNHTSVEIKDAITATIRALRDAGALNLKGIEDVDKP